MKIYVYPIVSIILILVPNYETLATKPQIVEQRQTVSYTTSILHEDPKNPNKNAQSTVKVILDPPKKFDNQEPKTKSFNVGYSMSFGGLNGARAHARNPREPEIITGTQKLNEPVQRPPSWHHGLLLSPQTENHYRLLEQLYREPSNRHQTRMALDNNYNWRNLGPGVEIIRSTEIPFEHTNQNENMEQITEKPINLDEIVVVENRPRYKLDTRLMNEPIYLDTHLIHETIMNEMMNHEPLPYQKPPLYNTQQMLEQFNRAAPPAPARRPRLIDQFRPPPFVIKTNY